MNPTTDLCNKAEQVDGVEVLADNRQLIEFDKNTRNEHLKLAGRVPQIGMTHIDFVPQGRMVEAMPMALNDFRLKLDFTAANQAFKIYAVSIQGVAPVQ